MTAFVLGATGFVGREVVRQLCVRATPVVAHVRPDSIEARRTGARGSPSSARRSTHRRGMPTALAQGRDRATANELYILIGTTRGRAKADSVEGDIYEQIDYGLTKIAVAAARASAAKPRLVYLSGMGADANARGAYMRARGKAEDAVRGSGLPWVIARPAIITGRSRRVARAASARPRSSATACSRSPACSARKQLRANATSRRRPTCSRRR